MKEKATIIIPARNEEPRIAGVLSATCGHPLVGEIIVVNDGSTDGTLAVCQKYNVKILNKKHSSGSKTLAVKEGLSLAKNDVVILLDADLIGLTAENITELVQPVLDKKVDFTLAILGNSAFVYKMCRLDFVSGLRAIRKSLLSDPEIWRKPKLGYGLEVLMNDSLLSKKKTFISVYLPNLHAAPKSEKMSRWRGTLADMEMVINIFRAFPILNVGLQFVHMVSLNHLFRKSLETENYIPNSIHKYYAKYLFKKLQAYIELN